MKAAYLIVGKCPDYEIAFQTINYINDD